MTLGSDHLQWVLWSGTLELESPLLDRSRPRPQVASTGQTGGGSIRSIVSTRSIERSKEATLPTPVLSARDEVRLGEVDAVGLVHLDRPAQLAGTIRTGGEAERRVG